MKKAIAIKLLKSKSARRVAIKALQNKKVRGIVVNLAKRRVLEGKHAPLARRLRQAPCQHAPASPPLVGTLSLTASLVSPAPPFGRRLVRKSSRGVALSIEPYRLGQRFVARRRARPEQKELKARPRPSVADKRRAAKAGACLAKRGSFG